jgi:hypothetical protein
MQNNQIQGETQFRRFIDNVIKYDRDQFGVPTLSIFAHFLEQLNSEDPEYQINENDAAKLIFLISLLCLQYETRGEGLMSEAVIQFFLEHSDDALKILSEKAFPEELEIDRYTDQMFEIAMEDGKITLN